MTDTIERYHMTRYEPPNLLFFTSRFVRLNSNSLVLELQNPFLIQSNDKADTSLDITHD